jgi:hypothetical protein
VTVFNLTGSNLVASNDLLVFVNVLGSWYGLILNAPAGTTAASLGGGVDQYTTVGDVAAVNISNDSTQTIANNVHVAAKSGDATVAKNTSAGSARSGDATASVNLLNMINNSISLDGWFGILFINVFGTWHGSFGVNTAAGDPVHIPSPVAEATNASTQPQLFRFVSSSVSNVPGKQNSSGLGWSAATTDTSVRYDEPTSPAMVLASHVAKTPLANITAQAPDAVQHNILVMLLGAALAFLILIFGERRRIFRHHYIRPARESR